MKKGNLLEGILFVLTGIILLGVALLTDSVLDSLLIGFAAATISSGIFSKRHKTYRSESFPVN